jgi:hypothetical protein
MTEREGAAPLFSLLRVTRLNWGCGTIGLMKREDE